MRCKAIYLLFLIGIISGVSSVCPDGWEEYGQKCYYFSNRNTETTQPWHEALALCRNQMALLVVVETSEENDFLVERLEATNNWIGLHSLKETAQWQWVDGSDYDYEYWAESQPDFWENAPGGTENCVEMVLSNDGHWNDRSCVYPAHFICERPNDLSEIPVCDVDEGWENYGDRCYKFVTSSSSWTTANSNCKNMGAELAAITSSQEQDTVALIVDSRNERAWIGLSNVNSQSGEFYWSNEVDLFSPSSYTNWADGEPSSSRYSKCAELLPDTTNNAPWSIDRCGEEHSYICETGLTGSCADGWRLYGDSCYYFVLAENAWGTWVDAKDNCAAMGGNILVIESEDEQLYISEKLPEFVDVGASEFWLGISDSLEDGKFRWEDELNTLVESGTYINWNKNQPVDRKDAWDCVQIYTGFYLGRWETEDCFRKQPYVCEMKPGVSPKPLVPVANTHKGCDPDWLWFEGNCYYWSTNKMIQWTEAESKCVQQGGHLASVLTGEENSFLIDHATGSTWIGGHEVLDVNQLQWTDGSPWGFTDWANLEPYSPEQGCVLLWQDAKYQWDDGFCTDLKNYVCKKPEQDCWEPLGMESHAILDGEITASSEYDEYHAAYLARLNNNKDGPYIGAWSCNDEQLTTQGDAWIQIHLLTKRTVSGIVTQGRPSDANQFVKSYKVAYSDDGLSFAKVKDKSGQVAIFTGNVDTNSKVTNRFISSVVTKYIRIYPWTYNEYIAMRLELVGCKADGEDLPTSAPNECSSVALQDRLDCGYSGVTIQECRSKGCCYDDSVPDTKLCFYSSNDFDPRCGKGWEYDPGGQFLCYHFNPYKIRDRNDAREYCRDMGGDLLSINSKHEQYYVTAQVTSLVSVSAIWIGANQLDPENGWQWSNGQPFNYMNWHSGEPNNWTGEEECVELYTNDGTWNDNPCYYQRGIACKKYTQTAPIDSDNGKYTINICEGDTGFLTCPGNDVIIIHHASYGRTSFTVCNGNGDPVPNNGCHSSNSLQVLSDSCNNKQTCEVAATNEVFGDPCHGVYKYLNVIYGCEAQKCFEPLGVENKTIPDGQISESSSLDSSHRGTNGRLNSATSWATNGDQDEWMQVLLNKHMRVSGILIQGAGDADRWVTTFKLAYAKDETNSEWIEYETYDDEVAIFEGNTDKETIRSVTFAERVYTTGIRIYPLTWHGDMLGMRMEVSGCNPFLEITCFEIGDNIFSTDDEDGKVIQADCPGYCPELLGYQYDVYGTEIYSGNSQICSSAIHAGAISDDLGGPVTIIKQPGQSSYQGTERHSIGSEDLNRYTPIAFSFSNPDRNCPSGWVPYDEYCFLVIMDQPTTWAIAEASCVQQDAHLVSIHNSIDQDFLFQTQYLSGAQHVWIGLNDLRSVNEYEWTDSTYVTYTQWARNEPAGRVGSCIYMKNETGKWADANCETIYPYVCKKYKGYYVHDDGDIPTPPPGCPADWIPYEGNCYYFKRDQKSYDDSKSYCAEQDATPVEILDKYTQSFFHTLIGVEDYRWWIGLVATTSTDGTEWMWETGSPFQDYDNWARGNPDVTNGKCTVFFGGQLGSGMWYSYACANEAFTICQKLREGWTPRPETTLPPSGGCPGSWSTPNENSAFCYRIYAPEASNNFDQPIGWSNAYHQCLATGGDLLSLHDSDEEDFMLDLIKDSLKGSTQGFWIGLNNKDTISEVLESGWEWTDGSPVNFLRWTPGYPQSEQENNCVELRYEGATALGGWKNINCDEKRDWICKLKKGITILSPTLPPTGVPNSQCGSATDGTWLEFDSLCYLFYADGVTSWHAAQRACESTGSTLASVHTHNEQSFITNQIQNMEGTTAFWIGLREFGGVDGQYTWLDGTALDYVNWNAGEPNDALSSEQCVDILEPTGRWNDANCGIEVAGYICKKRIGDTPAPPVATQPWPGACPSGWLVYDNYCYQVHGGFDQCPPDTEDWSDGECRATWYDAHQKCLDLGADLVTIHNKYENAFVAAHIFQVPIDVWIGLSDEHWYNKYVWSSGEEVTYTNWNTGEPNHANGEENCAEFYQRENIIGRWNDNKCSNIASYACQMDKDPSLNAGNEINNNKRCPKGWMQYDTVNDNYICYYLDSTQRTFSDARSNCQSMKSGADLTSFQSMYEQSFVTSYVKDTTAWIGLQYNQDEFAWQWVDNWPVWISNWGEFEPGSDESKLCAVNKDSYVGSEWVTDSCEQKYASICRWTTESVPPTPPTIDGNCPDDDWNEYGGFCYQAFTMDGDTEK